MLHLFLLLFLSFPFWPVRLSLYACRGAFTRGEATLTLLFFRLSFPFRLYTPPQGKPQLLMLPRKPGRPPHAPSPGMTRRATRVLRALHRADKARRLLARGVYLHRLDLRIQPALNDAAATAWCTGVLHVLTGVLPARLRRRSHMMIYPDFLAEHSRWQFRCIISTAVGILLIASGMALTAYLRERHRT